MKLRSLFFFFGVAAFAHGASVATCTIFRYSLAAHAHVIALQDMGVGACGEDFSANITFPNGTSRTVEKRATAQVVANENPDARGFFTDFEPDTGYTFSATAEAGGNGIVRVGDVHPGEGTAFEFAYGVAEANFVFYRRTFTITNPAATTGGFGAEPISHCFSNSLGGRGECLVNWSTSAISITPGTPFTVTGTASVLANGQFDAKDAQLVLNFRDPASYTFVVRDSKGGVIPESEWQTGKVPEPAAFALVGSGIVLALLLQQRASAAGLRATKLLRLTR